MKHRWLVRPIICLSLITLCGTMEIVSLIQHGVTDIVPSWLQVATSGSIAWWFFDRTLVHRLGDKEDNNGL